MNKIVVAMFLNASAIVLTQGCAISSEPSRNLEALFSKKVDKGLLALSDYDRGKHYIAVGDYGLAIDAFNSALEKDTDPIPAINGLAIAYDRIGRQDVARLFLDRAIGVDPNSPETLNNLGYFYLSHGDRVAAMSYMSRARDVLAARPEGDTSKKLSTVVANNIADTSGRPQAGTPTAAARAEPRSEALQAVSPKQWVLRVDPAQVAMTPRPLAVTVSTAASVGPKKTDVTNAPIAPQPGPVSQHSWPAVRVANSTGRQNMAHRFQDYFAGHGVPVKHLVNLPGDHRGQSTVYYSRGLEKPAAEMARMLPVPVRMVGLSNNFGEVELILAPDLESFDKKLADGSDARRNSRVPT